MNQNVTLENGAEYALSGGEVFQNAGLLTETVGQKLFNARKALRESDLEKVSTDLCIRPHLLIALEQDNFNKFPSACYAAGFLKNYAAYLGLNVGQIVAQYKKDFTGSTKKVDLVFLEVDQKHNHTQQTIISMVILTALVIYGVWYSMKGNDRLLLSSSLPDVSDVTSGILAKVVNAEPKLALTARNHSGKRNQAFITQHPEQDQGFNFVQKVNASPVAAGMQNFMTSKVRLSAREDTWVRIIDGNRKILLDRILLAGEKFSLANRKGLTLMTSNAGALSIVVGDNVALSSLGRRGEVRSGISLNQDDLLMNVAKAF